MLEGKCHSSRAVVVTRKGNECVFSWRRFKSEGKKTSTLGDHHMIWNDKAFGVAVVIFAVLGLFWTGAGTGSDPPEAAYQSRRKPTLAVPARFCAADRWRRERRAS
jgi:hypothetical protein